MTSDFNNFPGGNTIRHLGGVMVNVLDIGPKVRVLKPGRGDGFLRAIKIRCTTSFGRKLKPEVPCRKILRHVKEFYEYEINSQ
jgi:hypothetical protein